MGVSMNKANELSRESIPNPSNLMNKAMQTLAATSAVIHRSYLANLHQYPLLLPEEKNKLSDNGDVALFHLERIVTENRQAILESATAAYTALGSAGYCVFFLIEGDQKSTRLYIGARGQPGAMNGFKAGGELITKSIIGHFPGSKITQVSTSEKIRNKLNFAGLVGEYSSLAVTSVTGIPALNTEDREHFIQGLERLLDAAEGSNYRALLLAEPVPANQINTARAGFEASASQLSPLLKQSLSYGINESESVATSLMESFSTSLGESIGLTETHGTNFSKTITDSQNQSTTKDPSMVIGSITAAVVGAGVLATALSGGVAAPAAMAAAKVAGVAAGAAGKGVSSAAIGSKTSGSSTSVGTTEGHSDSTSNSSSTTETSSTTESKTDTSTTSVGSSRQLTIEAVNKPVEQLLARIDQHLERLDEARAYGGWQTAAYFIGDGTAATESLGSMFLGLMRGSTSGTEDFAITTWSSSQKEHPERPKQILAWLQNLTHPRFTPDFIQHLAIDYVTPAALLSGRELAIQLSLPRRSTSAVTVLEVPPYGRSIGLLDLDRASKNEDDSLLLGHIRHLWKDTQQSIELEINKLCYHTLITGTTGVGKTTAIMSLLAQVHKKGIPFLAVEPVKGEYRRLLGLGTVDCPVTYRVAGRTGPDALRINPLVFPRDIELSDHIDRVCTVFNAAFPMYAAMPQVLEEAIFTAYEELGWDSITSTCLGGVRRFPTLRRVADLIPHVVQQLGYSEQLSSDYTGALSTRLRSLCRGSLGMTLLCSEAEETTDQELFERSAVVDLSPMGSPEKRALLMGILFMRMYEKRLRDGLPEVTGLRHLMVLEEAHVLLKRTSVDQNQESSNPRGLAVEAFSNALAEMRAFGQGFIVADQSASVLDDAVLRNTNTKIVMRAPFEADRVALGGALALDEKQTQQLARLENQTAVVHQSNWVEPVLCRIKLEPIPEYVEDRHDEDEKIRRSKNRLALLLWNNRFEHPKEEWNLACEDELGSINDILNIPESQAINLKKILSQRSRLSWDDIRPYIKVLFPRLGDSALSEMTSSIQAQINHIYSLVETELGNAIDQENIKTIVKDIVLVISKLPAKEVSETLNHFEKWRVNNVH